MPEQDRSRLLLFVLGVAAVHALCLAAILPALISLPGQGADVTQGGIVKEDALVKDAVVDVEVLPSASTPPDSGAYAGIYGSAPSRAAVETVTAAPEPSPAGSLSPTPDTSDTTSALPVSPQNADTVPGDPVTAESAAVVTATTPTPPDLVGNNASPAPPPSEDDGAVSVADPESTNAIPSEEAKPATSVSLPTEKPDAAEQPSVKPRTTVSKTATAKPRMRRQASVAKPQTRGLFGGFFQSKPRPKPQRTTTSRP